jgi:hypothetical protein
MIERAMGPFDLYPARLLGDSAYGSAEMLGWLVYEHGIEPHVSVFDKSARKDGTFSREDFKYDPAGDVYVCPGGKTLTTTGTRVNDGATLLYRASKIDCDGCALKPRCCRRKWPARCRGRSTRARVILRVRSPSLGKAACLGGCAKRSRCCSPTSIAFSSSIASDYEDLPEHAMSSSSHQPPRTSGKLAKLIPIPNPKPA